MAKLQASKTTQLGNPLNIYKALGTKEEREDECTGLSVGSLCKQICCSARLEPVYSVSFLLSRNNPFHQDRHFIGG